MSADVKHFKTRRHLRIDNVASLLHDPDVEHALLLTKTKDGLWHVGAATGPGMTSIELVGILEMVKQDVIDDYNVQNPR